MFYVYEWFIVDTLEVFYVGKGTGKRRFETHNRNKYFNSVYTKYNCAVRLVAQSLTNEEACLLEIQRIAEMKAKGMARCNFNSGGTGFSEGSLNPRAINRPTGDKNPMYGIKLTGELNPFFGKKHSEQTKNKISVSRKGKGARFGEDNPMFGRGFKGEENPMFGKTGFDHPHSKMYEVVYRNGETEFLKYKDCEKKFGIAFTRIYADGGVLAYKKNTPNKQLYEGTIIKRVK